MLYSRVMCCPRRAIFSVRIERLSSSTVTAWADPVAASNGSSMSTLPVSSTANITAVSGERIVPPIIAAMPSRAQKPASPGRNCPSSQPAVPPKISSGARTPPDVPEASAITQIADLTASSLMASVGTISPERRSPIMS